ncbi:hypothetical protein HCTV5_26 [Halovirus HCTV-5]|uniref:hypothetical protein n=1 Tax=Halovirus HCTV-5 TaxID=1273748 RepID=UPI0003348490|nr:hypothetical protein M200_gp026 [Halovirus HCTV-5]AGM11636.1 hypothetical protein HCTV5_26 [Halovirus HCTV-5]
MSDDYISKMWDRIIEEEEVVSVETEKGRVYVDDPSQAPDDANVQQGDQGGYFYETDGGSSGSGDGGDSEDSGMSGSEFVEGINRYWGEEDGDSVVTLESGEKVSGKTVMTTNGARIRIVDEDGESQTFSPGEVQNVETEGEPKSG